MYDDNQINRFWRKVLMGEPEECWNWIGAKDRDGYGGFRTRNPRRWRRSHLVSFEISHGSIPEGGIICHSCDNPSCCNPNHLWVGSHKENRKDCLLKERWKREQYGTRNPNAKLNDDAVREIRGMTDMNDTEVARVFGVHNSTIGDIRRGKTWKHVAASSS